jgi:hypothetical protein
LWTNKESYAVEDGLEGLTEKESKLASYWNTPFKKICLGMTVTGVTRWMVLDYEASSLYSLIADGKFRQTSAGKAAWSAMIPSYTLQPNCNREGFNTGDRPTVNLDVRLAFLGNNEGDCVTCDSWIGYGHVHISCGSQTNQAFGYIFVQ